MARTYTVGDLAAPVDTTKVAWALALARFLSRDIPNGAGAWPDHSIQDEEWQAYLEAHSFTSSAGVKYYRPHIAAAAALEENPIWLKRLDLYRSRQEYRDVYEAARAIRGNNTWVDDAIFDASGEQPSAGVEVGPAF